MRADKRFFTLNYRSLGCSDNWGIISDIKVDEGITTITLRSVLQVPLFTDSYYCNFIYNILIVFFLGL